MRITQFYLRTGSFGKTCFDVHHGHHCFLCGSFVIAGHLEHFNEVFLIFIADTLRLLVILQIVVTLSHSETALIGLHHVHRAVHIIRTNKHGKVRTYSFLLTFGNVGVNLFFIFERIDSRHFFFDRSCSFFVQLHAVHSDVIKITHFLGSTARSIVFLCSQFGNQFFQLFAAFLMKHIERAEA